MKILITGANGQLGSDCQKILAHNHTLIPCDLNTPTPLNIGNGAAVKAIFTKEKPDIIINCAAFTAVDRCETETELTWRANATGPENLAKEAAIIGARLIHVSTDYVFDGNKPVPEAYKEDDATNPLSEYGRSKLAGEKAILQHLDNTAILRTAWLYSATGGNFLKTMLKLAIADPKRELKVVDDQYGSLTWSYPLAQQIEQLLDSDIRGVVHTTAEGYSSWYEAACYFLDKINQPYTMRPCTTAEYPTPAHRPANSILENAKLKEKGCNLFVSWQEHLDQFVTLHGDALYREIKEKG